MSLEAQLKAVLAAVGGDIKKLSAAIALLSEEEQISTYRTNPDSNGIYTTISFKRPDGTLKKQSVISGGVSPLYTTRTTTYYDTDGTTVTQTFIYNLSYVGGVLVSEELIS